MKGQREMYSLLIEKYQEMVFTVAYRVLGDESAAKDAAQESFISAYLSLGHFRGNSKFSSWLVSITLNKCRDMLRRRKEVVPLPDMADTLRSGDEDPLEQLETKQTRDMLQEALNMLPNDYREAVVLKHVQGLDYHEMSELCGVSEGALKVRVHRGREMLRNILREGDLSNGTGRKAGTAAAGW
ncbi:MAG: sigma-70 family RNA polymerase sigma factor [Nitrospirota bacterium]